MDPPIFDFERDFAGSLRCIPMAVRFKLDACCIKLSLRQWSRFSAADRTELLCLPCETLASIRVYRERLCALIRDRVREEPQIMQADERPEWSEVGRLPEKLLRYVGLRELPAPSLKRWAAITDLQRFSLLKLTREGHKNDNFEPAMREFGVLDDAL